MGLHNLRYFLGFIFYLWVGCFVILVPATEAYYDKEVKYNSNGMVMLMLILALVIGFVMIFFNGWNWYLALSGNTAIDFWMGQENTRKVSQSEISVKAPCS